MTPVSHFRLGTPFMCSTCFQVYVLSGVVASSPKHNQKRILQVMDHNRDVHTSLRQESSIIFRRPVFVLLERTRCSFGPPVGKRSGRQGSANGISPTALNGQRVHRIDHLISGDRD